MGRPKSAVLVINLSNSLCGKCGEGAFPEEKTHKTVAGWGVPYDHDGCGVRWKYTASEYEGTEKAIKKMRPDLEYIGVYFVNTIAHAMRKAN